MKTLQCCLFAALIALTACGGSDSSSAPAVAPEQSPEEKMLAEGKGIGEVKFVEPPTPLDATRISRGKAIYDMKCAAGAGM